MHIQQIQLQCEAADQPFLIEHHVVIHVLIVSITVPKVDFQKSIQINLHMV